MNCPESNTSSTRFPLVAVLALSFFSVRFVAEVFCGFAYQHNVASPGSILASVLFALIPVTVSTSIVAFVKLPTILSYVLLAAVAVLHTASVHQSIRYATHGKITADWGPVYVLVFEAGVMLGIMIIAGVTRGILYIHHNTR